MSDVLQELSRKVKKMQAVSEKKSATKRSPRSSYLIEKNEPLPIAAITPRVKQSSLRYSIEDIIEGDSGSDIDQENAENAPSVAPLDLFCVKPPWESQPSRSSSRIAANQSPSNIPQLVKQSLQTHSKGNVIPVDLANPMSLIKEIPSIRLRKTLIPRTPGGTPQDRLLKK
ncbi:UNVERIFIED_CONTAM: hypothetical protein HDU68_011075 [Siphonaria sp. JEL0065]|nr:hypothetical protein HDU68_011075 [Siphonaria sp. JEL0065]